MTAGAAVTLTARMDDSHFSSGGYGDEPVQPIVAARYTISTPTWIPGTLTFAMAAADGLFDEPIEEVFAALDTQAWRPGRYLLLTEGQDAAGNWGAPTGTFLEVLSTVHGLTVTPQRAAQRVELGADAHYSITVTNSGQVTDTFRISVPDADWPVQIEPTRTPPLAPRSSIEIEIVVSTPATLDSALTGETRIEVLSISEPALKQIVELVTRTGYELLFPVFTR